MRRHRRPSNRSSPTALGCPFPNPRLGNARDRHGRGSVLAHGPADAGPADVPVRVVAGRVGDRLGTDGQSGDGALVVTAALLLLGTVTSSPRAFPPPRHWPGS